LEGRQCYIMPNMVVADGEYVVRIRKTGYTLRTLV
jgi:hypothetical protein